MKIHRYLRKKCLAFLVQIGENEPKKKKIEDIPVIRNYRGVFPDELPGLPPQRQVEFWIDLVPGTVPVAKAPYRVAPAGMQELWSQLQEIAR